MNRPLTLRHSPRLRVRDLTSRLMRVRAATLNEGQRSVEVVMSTEGQVTVYDWERGIIDEVLVARGGVFPEQLPFLDNHYRYSLENVLGSVRGIRREDTTWVGRAFFAEGDKQADAAWNKTRQGHLTDVSVGYRALEFTDIPPGQRQVVAGREYVAGRRTLRVTTRWEAKELSLVPIGADRNTKVRTQPGSPGGKAAMPKHLRKYLLAIGLRSDATTAEAKAFLAALRGAQRRTAAAIKAGTMTAEAAIEAAQAAPGGQRAEGDDDDDAMDDDAGDGEDDEDDAGEEDERAAAPLVTRAAARRGATAPRATARTRGTQRQLAAAAAAGVGDDDDDAGELDPEQIRRDSVRAERDRVTQIRELAGDDVPREIVLRAEAQGWSVNRASREFLTAVRGGRQPAVGADATGGIVRNRDRDATARNLGLALAIRSGMTDQQIQRSVQRLLGRGEKWENVADQADRFRDMSLFDVCREAIRLDGVREIPVTRDETIRAAVSGGSLTNIFTTNVNATLMIAWVEADDTTVGWVQEVDVADFKTMEEIDATPNARLERLGRGGTAKDASLEDTKETWKIARYAKKFSVSEEDIIDDNMSVLVEMPQRMGEAARQLRPDMVYAMLLANPALNADGTAVFHADHNNLGTGGGSALASDSLKAGITAMGKQTKGPAKDRRNLNIKARFLLAPQDLKWTASELLNSATIFKITGENATKEFGSQNSLAGENLDLRTDNRLGLAGVTDPVTGTRYTGTATNWMLAAAPGRTIKMGYLRGTGRAPQIRPYVLDKGQWGVGWDVKLDLGATFLDFRGFYKANGA